MRFNLASSAGNSALRKLPEALGGTLRVEVDSGTPNSSRFLGASVVRSSDGWALPFAYAFIEAVHLIEHFMGDPHAISAVSRDLGEYACAFELVQSTEGCLGCSSDELASGR